MRKTLITTLLGAVLSFAALQGQISAQTASLKWVADIPIMPTLTVEPDLSFAFVNADGRIVRIYLSGNEQQSNVTEYYAQALEPLGWERIGENQWGHETEILEIGTVTVASTELWEITISPE
jgi:hypothetical protein